MNILKYNDFFLRKRIVVVIPEVRMMQHRNLSSLYVLRIHIAKSIVDVAKQPNKHQSEHQRY